MINPVKNFANVLLDYSTRVSGGDKVRIFGGLAAEPLIRELYIGCLMRGANPFVEIKMPGFEELLYRYASDTALRTTPSTLMHFAKTYDVNIVVWTEDNTRALTNVDPGKTQAVTVAKQPISKIALDRSAAWTGTPWHMAPPEGSYRWCVTLWPTAASAMEADMGTEEFKEFVFNSVGAFRRDPILFWQEQAQAQEKYVDFLNEKKILHFKGPFCNITFNVTGRKWINCDGRFNMPDGEVFTAPHENYTNGWVRFTAPTLHNGRLIEDVVVNMANGKCIKAQAKTEAQGEYVNKMLDSDEDGSSRILGELAFGLNPGITIPTKEILFDEKINGTFHMAFGKGYPESGSLNDSASLHWDMICDMSKGEVFADDKLIYKDGKFTF
ncbi:MAG: aminopeptidase [Thermoplasmata archaeon]|nr:aminopeptidase [Thermoplasmata archaeon]